MIGGKEQREEQLRFALGNVIDIGAGNVDGIVIISGARGRKGFTHAIISPKKIESVVFDELVCAVILALADLVRQRLGPITELRSGVE